MIEVRVLGGVSLRAHDGRVLTSVSAQPKRVALLTYVAIARPLGLRRRDKLVALFWPESDTAHARGSLRKAIHAVRRELGRGALVTRADDVALSPDCWCDAVAFSDAVAAERDEEALAFYQGELLEGVFVQGAPAFEHWLDGERARLRADALRASHRLLQHYHRRGNLIQAVDVARRAMAIEPDEPTLRQLMELLDQLGDRAGAIKTYNAFAGSLARDYASEPSIETSNLADRLRADRAPRPLSIVVLPFANLSPDPDTEYVGNGLTDEIIKDLSNVKALRVISRNSAMRLQGTTKDIRTIGRELNVQFVLEGSVRKAGTNLEVAAQLIDTKSDCQLWADRYVGALEDVFDVQDRLSRTIVRALAIALRPDEERRIAQRRMSNIHIYECYHRARQELWRFDRQGLDRATELIRSGLEMGGDSDLLYAIQGQVFLHYVVFALERDRALYFGKVLQCAERVASLNAESPFRFALPALVHFLEGDRQRAVKEFKRALAIDPNDPDILGWLIALYDRAGHAAPARPLVERLLAVDPLNPHVHAQTGWLDLIEHGDAESCVRSCRKAYQMDTQSPYGRFLYASALCWAAHVEESCAMLEAIERDTPAHGLARLGTVLRHALSGNREAALGAITPDLVGWAEVEDVASWVIGDSYALLGEVEEAARWIANAAKRGAFSYPMLAKHDRLLSGVRSDPRFQAVLEDVKQRWEAFEP